MPRRPPPPAAPDRLTVLLERSARERQEAAASFARAGIGAPRPGAVAAGIPELRIERGWVPGPPQEWDLAGALDPEVLGALGGAGFVGDEDDDDGGDGGEGEEDEGGESARVTGERRPGERRAGERRAGQRRAGRHRGPRSGPTVVSVPTSLRGARVTVSWAALVGIALLVLLAAAVFTIRVGSARAEARPRLVVETPRSSSTGTASSLPRELTRTTTPAGFAAATPTGAAGVGSSPTTAAQGSTPTGSVAAASVVVDVVGHVVRPGIVRAAAGARVVDALALAGGARSGADLARLNLARVLVDGEQIYVPVPGESPPPLLGSGSGGSGAAGVGSARGDASPSAGRGAIVDLNRADLTALDALPGVGPVLAQRILDWRTQHGRFSSVEELGEVSGIGDKVLGDLRPLVTV